MIAIKIYGLPKLFRKDLPVRAVFPYIQFSFYKLKTNRTVYPKLMNKMNMR